MMFKYIRKILLLLLLINVPIFSQFGQNRVHYKVYDWLYIQTTHFDIYFEKDAKPTVEFLAVEAEKAMDGILDDLSFKLTNRISLILYNSHNDFQETNTVDAFLSQGIGGFTERFKNRVVFPFEGSYSKFRHVIHHELVHAVMNDFLYGGNIQNMISRGITLNLPIWVHEGMAEFLSTGWETNSDMFIRDAIINEYLPDIERLNGYFAYRGGQSLFKYISDTYGRKKIADLLSKMKGAQSLEKGLKSSLGLELDELNDRWKKSLKKSYWPEIAFRDDPDDFSERLTNNKKLGGFYNTSPAISPMGDKVAFISDRDVFMDLYVMDIDKPEDAKRIITSGQTNDFEELNVLFPSLAWSPDNISIALVGKKSGYDIITIINTETDDYEELPINFDGIESISWSRDANKLAFVGHNDKQSDIYVYNFETGTVINITDDIFSDSDPHWNNDDSQIYFSSDRGDNIEPLEDIDNFEMWNHNFNQLDIYSVSVDNKRIKRLTDWEFSSERSPIISNDGKELLFVSDHNGIFNLYKKNLEQDSIYALTNSLNGINQLSISSDNKKLVYTSLFKSGYNIFMFKNPFEMSPVKELPPTNYMASLLTPDDEDNNIFADTVALQNYDSLMANNISDSTAVTDSTEFSIYTGEVINEEEEKDSTEAKYRNYVFGDDRAKSNYKISKKDTVDFSAKLDTNGNYLIHKYKVSFTPDLVYANAGYSSLYGLLGTTVLSFSDMLGNHRLIGITSMQMDLKNSDYGLSYYYLPERISFGVDFFHTARFVYLQTNAGNMLYRFRNYGGIVSASFPISRFFRLDGSLGVLNVSSENLEDVSVPEDKNTFIIPSLSFVHDNSIFGYTAPIQGARYKITVFGNPGIGEKNRNFYSVNWDFRKYFRFWYDNSFAMRLSGGFSGGSSPQRFFMGGTDYWINRTFATGSIPLESAADFAFLTPALPLRGYDYAEQIGTKYSLVNFELRMPLIRYLLTGPIPLLFQNIMGVAFVDMGSAWNDNNSFKPFARTDSNKLITNDALLGTGFGVRVNLLFLWRIDVAWKYNLQVFSTPRYYISMGIDF